MDDEKKVFKINLTTLILIIIIIVLLVVVAVMGFMMAGLKGYVEDDNSEKKQVVTDKKFEEKEFESKNETQNKLDNSISKNTTLNKINNATTGDDANNEYIAKIVENRGYIYDAQYTSESVSTKEYVSSDENTYNISDIKVPYVNMVSSDAKDVNSEIEKLYQGYIGEFKICSENKNSFIKTEYKTYVTANIISILITIERGKETNKSFEYVSYNFDTISGSKLDYSQVYEIAGIRTIGENVEKTIDGLEDFEEYKLTDKYPKEAIEARNEEIEMCKTQIYTYYQQDILNSKLVYFLDNNLKLNIAIKVVLPAEGGSYSKLVIVEA